MRVVICEDNIAFAQQIETYITNYAFIENNSIQVILNTESPKNLVDFIQNEKVDCFFLDIDFGEEMTGLDLAKAIRKNQPLASIIFITTHSEMLHLTFKYHLEALDFVIKDNNDIHQCVIKALVTAYEKYKKIGTQPDIRYYQIKMGDYIKNINIDDILYFKAGNHAHKVILYTIHGNFEFYQSLSEIENIDESFFRCHRSYIINLKNIKEVNIKSKTIIMKNEEECPLSFRKIKFLKANFKSI